MIAVDFMRIGISFMFANIILEVVHIISKESLRSLEFFIDLCMIGGTICLIIGYILGCGVTLSSIIMIAILAAALVLSVRDLIGIVKTIVKDIKEK